jgi:hypothetical protein
MICVAQRAADIPMSTINCCLIFLESNRDHTVELCAPPPQSHSACCSPTCQSTFRLPCDVHLAYKRPRRLSCYTRPPVMEHAA